MENLKIGRSKIDNINDVVIESAKKYLEKSSALYYALNDFLCDEHPIKFRDPNIPVVRVVFISGNAFDSHKLDVIDTILSQHSESIVVMIGGIGRLTTAQVAKMGGEEVAFRQLFITRFPTFEKQLVILTSMVPPNNHTGGNIDLLLQWLQTNYPAESGTSIHLSVVESSFLLKRLRFTILGRLRLIKDASTSIFEISFHSAIVPDIDLDQLTRAYLMIAEVMRLEHYGSALSHIFGFTWKEVATIDNDTTDETSELLQAVLMIPFSEEFLNLRNFVKAVDHALKHTNIEII